MKYEKPHNSAWPDWYDGKKINEIQFCYDFLESHPLKCIDGQFYTPDGPVENEAEIKQKVLLEIESYVTSGLSKKVSNILESLRLLAYSPAKRRLSSGRWNLSGEQDVLPQPFACRL